MTNQQRLQSMHLNTKAVAAAMEAHLLGDGSCLINDVQIDSRLCSQGTLFFALRGQNSDGFDFIEDACRRGCSAVVVSKERAAEARMRVKCAVLAVDDVRISLQHLSAWYVRLFPSVKTVGITGSCGKSTTKEALGRIASVLGPTAKTPGNLNSEYGLALSVFGLGPETRYGVFEMGIDHIGEMDTMVRILRPSIALLTNIGVSHLQKMGNQTTIAEQKARIFHCGVEAGFVSRQCRHRDIIEQVANRKLEEYDVNELQATDLGLDGWLITYENKTFRIKSVGRHLLEDVAGAIKVGRYLGASASDIANALEDFEPMQGRSYVHQSDVTIIDDCYNASLDSTNSILGYLDGLSWSGSKKVVLGPMKELGHFCSQAHRLVARKIAKSRFDQTYLYGEEMEEASKELRRIGFAGNVHYTRDFAELSEMVAKQCTSGDLYLLKASRSVAMERLIPSIQRRPAVYA